MPLKTEQINEFNEALERWAESVIPSRNDLRRALSGEKKLTIYHGIDPTGPHVHLGHSTNYLFLRRLQALGHRIILLIGDFTARIGDPSGRTAERVPLTQKQVIENAKTYKKQLAKLLDFDSKQNPVKLVYNSKWLSVLKFGEIIGVAAHFTAQQMLARDMFQKRIKDGNPIGLHEFLYPLMQGYDSVALKADIEVGGNDQFFNMMAGRDLVRKYLNKEKFVVTTKLLINPKTGAKLMSKSEGNYIALNDSPKDMYGKIMALPDEAVSDCFKLCTEVALGDAEEIMKLPPREAKARLAREITTMYHGDKASMEAGKEFDRVFSAREAPGRMREVKVHEKNVNIIELLLQTGLAPSKSEARRLVQQGGVRIDSVAVKDPKENIEVKDDMIIQVGRRRFGKLKISAPLPSLLPKSPG